jgi:hypothetical protein
MCRLMCALFPPPAVASKIADCALSSQQTRLQAHQEPWIMHAQKGGGGGDDGCPPLHVLVRSLSIH